MFRDVHGVIGVSVGTFSFSVSMASSSSQIEEPAADAPAEGIQNRVVPVKKVLMKRPGGGHAARTKKRAERRAQGLPGSPQKKRPDKNKARKQRKAMGLPVPKQENKNKSRDLKRAYKDWLLAEATHYDDCMWRTHTICHL